MSFTDIDYVRFDPFEGDRDVHVKCRTVKLVTTRKAHKCFGLDAESHGHDIAAGDRARYEHALVDGKWGSYYMCVSCMNKWLSEWK